MALSTWLPTLPAKLCQGDLFSEFPVGVSYAPPVYLPVRPFQSKDREVWQTKEAWEELPDTKFGHFVAKGRLSKLMLISQNCEIDKACRGEARGAVLVAPIRPLETLSPKDRDAILLGNQYCFFPLVKVPGLQDHYADLRNINGIQAKTIKSLTRLASMDVDGKVVLQAALVAYLTRPDDDEPAVAA